APTSNGGRTATAPCTSRIDGTRCPRRIARRRRNRNRERTAMKDAQRITGVLSPVVTPFKSDLSPDPERFVRQCKWLLSQNVGLAVFGTNSEANSLSVEERVDLLDRLVDAGVDPARMMPGTGCCALTDTV